jgi:hypothetical protein
VETIGHVVWSCSLARDVWLECTKKLQKSTSDEDAFINIFERLLECLNDVEIELIACVARQLWLRRNKLIFEESFSQPKVLIQQAKDQLEASVSAKQVLQARTMHNIQPIWDK